MWGMVDREVGRVTQEFQRLQADRVSRTDVPPTVIGSLLVGTYLLLAQQMSQMQEKPDLAAWAGSVHRLIHEGCVPPAVHTPRPPAPAKKRSKTSPRQPPQARALSRTRSTPRSGP
jgi:hypothetical protein